jgi:hypothetical protein
MANKRTVTFESDGSVTVTDTIVGGQPAVVAPVTGLVVFPASDTFRKWNIKPAQLQKHLDTFSAVNTPPDIPPGDCSAALDAINAAIAQIKS